MVREKIKMEVIKYFGFAEKERTDEKAGVTKEE